jgi:hypothetical protein
MKGQLPILKKWLCENEEKFRHYGFFTYFATGFLQLVIYGAIYGVMNRIDTSVLLGYTLGSIYFLISIIGSILKKAK